MTRTLRATTLRKFMKHVERIEKGWRSRKDERFQLWYRGLHKRQWPLVPRLYRPRNNTRDLLDIEDEIREEFVRRAPSLTTHKPANAWEWYFLMQHYGAPTRLLDWTESPQIGLYFAVREADGLHDAAVWVLDAWWLNDLSLGKDEVIPPGAPGVAEADAERYRPWLPDRFDAKAKLPNRLPVAIYPTQFDPRIAAQRACFTLHARRKTPLDKLFTKQADHLAKIVIPSYAVAYIRDELEDQGVDEVAVFPDLQGLGKCVSSWLPEADDKLPHAGLLTRLKRSPIHGVGVFAIRKIRRGTRLFAEDSDEMRWVRADELPRDASRRGFYEDFAIQKNKKDGTPKRYGCPRHFELLTMSWYLNDPKAEEEPNVRCDTNYDFWAARDIKEGDELTVDSRTYSQHATHAKTGRGASLRPRVKK